MIDEIRHLAGKLVGIVIFGGDDGLGTLFTDFFKHFVDAFIQQIVGVGAGDRMRFSIVDLPGQFGENVRIARGPSVIGHGVLIKAGGVGVISVAANAFPKYFSTMIKAQFEQQWGHTEVMFEKIRPVVKMLFAEGNPPGVKAALNVRGVMSNVLRLPLVTVSDELYGQIEAEIKANGFC